MQAEEDGKDGLLERGELGAWEGFVGDGAADEGLFGCISWGLWEDEVREEDLEEGGTEEGAVAGGEGSVSGYVSKDGKVGGLRYYVVGRWRAQDGEVRHFEDQSTWLKVRCENWTSSR